MTSYLRITFLGLAFSMWVGILFTGIDVPDSPMALGGADIAVLFLGLVGTAVVVFTTNRMLAITALGPLAHPSRSSL